MVTFRQRQLFWSNFGQKRRKTVILVLRIWQHWRHSTVISMWISDLSPVHSWKNLLWKHYFWDMQNFIATKSTFRRNLIISALKSIRSHVIDSGACCSQFQCQNRFLEPFDVEEVPHVHDKTGRVRARSARRKFSTCFGEVNLKCSATTPKPHKKGFISANSYVCIFF